MVSRTFSGYVYGLHFIYCFQPAPDPPSYDSVASTSSPYISTAANEAVSTYPDSGYTYASIVLKSETGK